jgi:hypothetical protein
VILALVFGFAAGLAWLAVVLARLVLARRQVRSVRADPVGLHALASIGSRGPPPKVRTQRAHRDPVR